MSYMITTVDNPIDPREDFRAWDQWDRAHGYNTSSYLDRVAGLPDELPDAVIDKMRDDVIFEIIRIHNGEMYDALLVDESSTTKSTTAA
jgi:hypothetical protein